MTELGRTMMIHQLIFTAIVPRSLTNDTIRSTLDGCHHASVRNAFNGVLVFERPYVVVCAEGSRTLLNRFLQVFLTPPFGGGFQILSFKEVHRSLFDSWATVAPALDGLPTDTLRPIYRRHGAELPFHPTALPVATLRALLVEIQRTYPLGSRAGSSCATQVGLETVVESLSVRPPSAQPLDSVP